MSDAPEAAAAAAAPAKKGKGGLIIAIVIAVVTLIGGSVAGAILGPKLLGGGQPKAGGEHGAEKAEGEGDGEEGEAEHGEAKSGGGHGESSGGSHGPDKITSVAFPAVVVDLRDQDERIRHLKIGINVEVPESVPEDEFKLYMPRGREAILTYMRSLNYEEVTDPTRYENIKSELGKRVTEAVGAKRVKRVLVVEFVSQ
jgi:flagellar basal body-associated protein FliL